ncbi:hypothetical protein [Nocardioides bruguierae]|uniref:Uncharacterized protein n=1 Tax=Nocardioides bruguierae TaxID=2945102 RepID=A0A9X2DBQ3_9ACTN|nr:hypothetical protein [Nocardioides bruguierae]MCM0622816.1 hypothetical protein [Nocardioides bruguierae]
MSDSLSLVAVVISLVALWHTFRQGRINLERWHRDQTPVIDIEAEEVSGGTWHRLRFELADSMDLDQVLVTIGGPHLVWFSDQQEGVTPGAASKSARIAPLRAGAREASLRVEWEDDDSHVVQLTLECKRGSEAWTLHRSVVLPAKPYDVLQSIL